MERLANSLKPATDSSKYNLRCNRNISEKMTKKDFVYDIPAPFQAMRKEKSLPSPVKKPRGNFECMQIPPRGISVSEIGSKGSGIARGGGGGGSGSVEVKPNKNPVGILRLIQPEKLQLPAVTTGTSYRRLNPQSLGKERIINEREDDSTETEIRRQIVLPIQIRRKVGPDSKTTRYAVALPERKILGYQCNICLERVATLLSLSTHVKYHRRSYCTTCFWVLEPEESMIQHVQKAHPDGRALHPAGHQSHVNN